MTFIRMSKTIRMLMFIMRDSFNNQLNPWFSLFITLWGCVFIEMWKRKQSTLAYQWDVRNFTETEPDRPSFYGCVLKKDPITKENIWVYTEQKRMMKYLASAFVILLLMGCVFLSICAVLIVKVQMRTLLNCPMDTENLNDRSLCVSKSATGPVTCFLLYTLLPAVVGAVAVVVLEALHERVALRLNEWENYQTESDFKNALILKLFLFQFVNSFSLTFYVAVFRPEGHGLQSNGLFQLGPEYQDTCGKKGCLPLLALQVLVLMIARPISKQLYDLFLPWFMKHMKRLTSFMVLCVRSVTRSQKLIHTNRHKSSTFLEASNEFLVRECQKPPVGNLTIEEFSEKVILFGYIQMFGAALPLAPVIGLLVCLVDLRIDATRLLWFNRRPIAYPASDIGMWSQILRFINIMGIVSNAFLVSTGTLFTMDFTLSQKLYTMLAFEHVMFVLIFVIDMLIPDVPQQIKQAERRETVQVSKVLEQGFGPNVKPMKGASPVPSMRLSRKPSCRSLIEEKLFEEAYNLANKTARGDRAEALRKSRGSSVSPRSKEISSSGSRSSRSPKQNRNVKVSIAKYPSMS